MFTVFKYAYQSWHTITKEDLQEQVIKGGLSPKQYTEITNEIYNEQFATPLPLSDDEPVQSEATSEEPVADTPTPADE